MKLIFNRYTRHSKKVVIYTNILTCHIGYKYRGIYLDGTNNTHTFNYHTDDDFNKFSMKYLNN